MRKDRRLTKDQLVPFMVEVPTWNPERSERGGGADHPVTPFPVPPLLHWPTLFGNTNPVEFAA